MAGAIGSGSLPHLLLVGAEDVHVSYVLPPLSEGGFADAGPIVLTVLARHRLLPLPCSLAPLQKLQKCDGGKTCSRIP
jgi:hypothetical protein